MAQNFGRRSEDERLAVIEEKQDQQDRRIDELKDHIDKSCEGLEDRFDKRCTKKEARIDGIMAKIEDLLAFQNRTIGIMALASGIATLAAQYFFR